MQVQPTLPAMRTALGVDEASPRKVPAGVLVIDLLPWGPAGLGGVRRGDLVHALNDQPVDGLERIVALADATTPGQTVDLMVTRQGEVHRLGLALTSWPPGWRGVAEAVAEDPRLGLAVSNLDDALRHRLTVRWGARGVMVSELVPGRPAARAGLAKGMIIQRVAGHLIVDAASLWRRLDSHQGDGWAPLLVQDGGGFHLLALPLSRQAPAGPRPLFQALGLRLGELPGLGLLVVDVTSGTALAPSVPRGAIIVGIDGVPPTVAALQQADRPLTLTLKVDGEAREVRLDPAAAPLPPSAERRDLPGVGLVVANRSDAVITSLGLRWGVAGVAVQGVAAQGPASGRLLPGDTVVAVNQHPVVTVAALADRLDAARAAGGAEVLLLVENVYGYRHVVLPLGRGDGPPLAPLLQLE
ncbi:PDZ domain-containing protein [Roseospirillum parvum]|nr:PDZ domain-containing protein [Roseospirillum parvum]